MAKLKTYRAWFRDDSMMLVGAVDAQHAKLEAEEKSARDLEDAYFESSAERRRASTVKSIECLD